MTRLSATSFLAAIAITVSANNIIINTPSTTMLLSATNGEELRMDYYGTRIRPADVNALSPSLKTQQSAMSAYGLKPQNETAISARHADGNVTLKLVVEKTDSAVSDNSTLYTIHLRDKFYPFYVDVNYLTRPNSDVIETWTDIWHTEKQNIELRRYSSICLPFTSTDAWVTSFHGSWANEANMTETQLKPGIYTIKDTDGVRNSTGSHPTAMISLDGQPLENTGRTIGTALCWSGNYEFIFETGHNVTRHTLLAGIYSPSAPYVLAKGEHLKTPAVALTYSSEGKGGVSRNFHKWARNYKIHNGTALRPVLLNSWEGVYFNTTEPLINAMIADADSMGVELFVMDDGWFGRKYPRVNDHFALGDWYVDTNKLPEGLDPLIHNAKQRGMQFGIWHEPEMVAKASELFEKHPDYILKAAHRDTIFGRGNTQLVLDLSNQKVQDLIVEMIDTLLTGHPGIDYIKWDANMSVSEIGSHNLDPARQAQINTAYHRGLEKVLGRIRAKHPRLAIQACASGGGRLNYGTMPWFDEYWTSDNTDPYQRLFIQWSTSHFYPAGGMASHISASPNHQTGRKTPLKFRTDVAMSGRLGLELQPSSMTPDERMQTKKAIAEYKQIRPVVQQGDLYRLLSPYAGKNATAHMQVSPDKQKAVFFWYRLGARYDEPQLRIPMAGLDPDKTYTVKEINRADASPLDFEGHSFSGRYLMDNGLEMRPASYGNIIDGNSSCILFLEAE